MPHYLFVAAPSRLPAASNGTVLEPLIHASREVHAIAERLPAGQAHILEGPEAEIDAMVRELPSTTVLHIATHAIVSDTEPFNSFLALDDGKGHGRLTLAETYNLHLHTSLVVLSACRTGRGQITGDGIEGLSRAFFSAGSASVLATLWDVADRPTAMLMSRFYQELQRGSSSSAALRSAQLSMIKDLRAGRITAESFAGTTKLPSNPAYWAAFTLAGEP